ncbi:hypothetical protein [Paenibacillus sp. OV219]|uniref:hypothetical protein n=1 Tax=Paenibacillus sp. OV219 TaxID=1884377 RepID=UPI0008C76877|nr:hypothetical protein [Paenibacillus sp. OV219]SEN36984.1 hypothetical protein SAMN05518847_102784 [Paenibacillus sp. OV219]
MTLLECRFNKNIELKKHVDLRYLLQVPVWAFHDALDDIVPVDEAISNKRAI